MTQYQNFLNEACKIHSRFQISYREGVESLKVERSNQSRQKRLLERIDIPTLFPSHPSKDDVQKLWSDFGRLVGPFSGSIECNPAGFDI